jgi:hypothetical protein
LTSEREQIRSRQAELQGGNEQIQNQINMIDRKLSMAEKHLLDKQQIYENLKN